MERVNGRPECQEKFELGERPDDTARDACTAVPRRLRNLIVGIGVHYEGASIGVEERKRSLSQRDAIRAEGNLPDAARRNDDIGRVTSVRPERVVQPVLFADWVVVRAGRRERCGSPLALSHLVEMNAVRARRESKTRNIDVNQPVRVLP